ncbi:hypothetical protein [Xanthobacter tagetidis]|nr:hypothetical protein [Xanthobacter tagetidis]MBB6309876.1 hypothetical protein [Xanthobacter tagetidis]
MNLDIAVIAILSVPRFVPNALLVRPGRPAAAPLLACASIAPQD